MVLPGVDGRTHMARRFREIVGGIASDMGDDLTGAQQAILDRAATLILWAEMREAELARGEAFDAQTYATCCNSLRRLLDDLGLHRVPKDVTTPDLETYLSRKTANG